jgi:hypothetical protein
VQKDRFLFGLAAVLAGIATLEFVLAFVYTPVLLAIAVPFAAAAYFVWYQASGRLRDRVESGRAGSYRRPGTGGRAGADPRDDSETGGFGAGPRDSYSNRRGGFDADREGFGLGDRFGVGRGPNAGRGRTRASAGRRQAGANAGRARVHQNAGPSPAEAYRVLGLNADATAEEVRRAYRERVKAVHPDREDGDEAEFKRVTEAYEVLKERF